MKNEGAIQFEEIIKPPKVTEQVNSSKKSLDVLNMYDDLLVNQR